jgi:hypothetical protein
MSSPDFMEKDLMEIEMRTFCFILFKKELRFDKQIL